MVHKQKVPKVVQQDIALDAYLSNLLEEIPDHQISEALEEKTVDVTVKKKPEVVVKKTEQIEPVVIKQTQALVTTHQATSKEQKLNSLAAMPSWAQQEFQALFFKVDTLILATPVTDLLRTIIIEKEPTKIPNQPSWFMGLLDEHDGRIGVLDTGQLIFGKIKGQQRDLETDPFKRILITHDGKWGLACDEIISIGKLQPEKVRWRTLRQKRPWLVGTVIEELIAVIDVDQIVPHRKQ